MTTTQPITHASQIPEDTPDGLLAEYALLKSVILELSADPIVMAYNAALDELAQCEAAIKALGHATGASWEGSGWRVKTTVAYRTPRWDAEILAHHFPWLEKAGALHLVERWEADDKRVTRLLEDADLSDADQMVVTGARIIEAIGPRTTISPKPLEDER